MSTGRSGNESALDAARAEAAEMNLAELRRLRVAMAKIDTIRNSIVGRQSVHWSLHIYPLVAALDEAGYGGEGYDVARPKALAEVAAVFGAHDRLRASVAALIGEVSRMATDGGGFSCTVVDEARAALGDR